MSKKIMRGRVRGRCVVCNKSFFKWPCHVRKESWGKYCSQKCQGVALSGKNHPNWKGGRVKEADGCFRVYCPTHPFASKRKYVLEHRLVMEKHLGRTLLPTEIVHHINGIKDDNRIENLQLFSSSGEHLCHHFKGKRLGKNNPNWKRKL